MAHALYEAIVAEDDAYARRSESAALSKVIEALAQAGRSGAKNEQRVAALDMHDALWCIFLEDLASDGNLLPTELRARLISIGLWAMRHSVSLRIGGGDMAALIDVNAIVRDGLGR